MNTRSMQVISVLVSGLVTCMATASETGWEPQSFSDPVGPATFAWIPAAAPVPALLQAGSLTAVVGSRSLGGAGWRQLGPAFQAGIDWSPGSSSWPVRPIVGYRHARGEGEYRGSGTYGLNLAQLGTFTETEQRGTLTAEVDEVALGIGRTWSWGIVHTSVGVGGCWVRAQVDDQPAFTLLRRIGQAPTTPSSDVDSGYGWWGAAGASVTVGKTEVGVEGRFTDAPVTVFGDQFQAGGWQLGARVGWTW